MHERMKAGTPIAGGYLGVLSAFRGDWLFFKKTYNLQRLALVAAKAHMKGDMLDTQTATYFNVAQAQTD